VHDKLFGRPAEEYDIATAATPPEVTAFFPYYLAFYK